tara:strand:+ start:478 stop:1188 length:711 start_codon:yes stop_codon:yes gene_type:complete
MLLLIIYLFFILIILIIISIINIKKYNKNSKLITLNSFDNIKNKRILDPLLFNSNLEFNKNILDENIINNYPENYYEINNKLIKLEDFSKNNNINIENNKKLIIDFNLEESCFKLYKLFSSYLSYNLNYNGSLLQQSNLEIKQNNNNILLINNIFGKCNILLINPKHQDYIKNNKYKLNQLKKISIIVNLKKDMCLYIPANWYYIIEIIDLTFIINISSDNYLTYFYNKYKKNINI